MKYILVYKVLNCIQETLTVDKNILECLEPEIITVFLIEESERNLCFQPIYKIDNI